MITAEDPLRHSVGLFFSCEPFIFLHGAPDPLQRALISRPNPKQETEGAKLNWESEDPQPQGQWSLMCFTLMMVMRDDKKKKALTLK